MTHWMALLALSLAAPHTFQLWNGSIATVSPDGFGVQTDARGRQKAFTMVTPQGRSPLGDDCGPSEIDLQRRLALPQRTPQRVIVGFTQEPGKLQGVKRLQKLPVQGAPWAMY